MLLCYKTVCESNKLSCIYKNYTTKSPSRIITYCELSNEASTSSPGKVLSDIKNENVTKFILKGAEKFEYMVENISETFPNLEIIQISHTSLKSLPKKSFQSLHNLTRLSLYSNFLSSLDEDIFDNLENLLVLCLENNKIESFPPKIFSRLSNLQSLLLNRNQITHLDADLFKNNKILKGLFLHYNQITSLSSKIFASCKQMVEIQLYNNLITTLPIDLIENSTNLSTFKISSNPLKSIDFLMFSNNKKMKDLQLQNIKFEKVLNIDTVDNLMFARIFFSSNLINGSISCVTGVFTKKKFEDLKLQVKKNCEVV